MVSIVSPRARRWLAAGILALGAPHAGASWSDSDEAIPGAHGAARLGGKAYFFARTSASTIRYRTTDGNVYGNWINLPVGGGTHYYPAAVTSWTEDFIALYVRGTDNALWVTRTFNGSSFEAWRNLGGVLTSAPAAVAFNGRIHVFVRDTDNGVHTRWSADGLNFSAWQTLGKPPAGAVTSAPVASVIKMADGGHLLALFARAADGGIWQRTTGDGTSPGTYGAWTRRGTTTLAANPGDQADYAIVSDLGLNFISGDYPAGSWGSYKMPLQTTMMAQIAKFNMVYDGTYPNAVFSAAQVQDAISRGAVNVILRLGDHRVRDFEVDEQLRRTLPGSSTNMLGVVAQNPGIQFWIEVGNESNLGVGALDPFLARYYYMTVMQNIAPKYRASHPNLRWMASLPTRHGGAGYAYMNYLDAFLSDTGDGRGTILKGPYEFHSLGIHTFDFSDLLQRFPQTTNNGQACSGGAAGSDCPNVVLDRVLARTGKTIFITEAGINRPVSQLSWYDKATYFIRAMRRMPSQVRGYLLWVADLEPRWCTQPAGGGGVYALDATYVSGSFCTPDASRPGATRLRDR